MNVLQILLLSSSVLTVYSGLSKEEWIDNVVNEGGGAHVHGFPSHDETLYILDSLAQWNPLFTRRFLTGISVNCRPLFGYWISGTGLWHSQTNLRDYLEAISMAFIASIVEEETEVLADCIESMGMANETLKLVSDLHTRLLGQDEPLRAKTWPNYGRSLFTSLHHAREPTSLTVPFYAHIKALQALGSQVASGPKNVQTSKLRHHKITPEQRVTAALLSQREVFWLPFVNPDGYIDIGNGADQNIRKNRRVTCDKKAKRPSPPPRQERSILTSIAHRLLPPREVVPNINLQDRDNVLDYREGVDINRNYDDHFVHVHNPCDPEEYEGQYAFSEPETRTVRRSAQIFNPQTALNFHSYGDLWTHPYNCCPVKKLNQTEFEVFQELHNSLNVTLFGSAPHLPVLGYTTTGEADDYLLSKYGIISMSPEVGPEEGGFYPEPEVRRHIHEENYPRILAVVSKAGPELSILLSADHCKERSRETYTYSPDEDSIMWRLTVFNSGLAPTTEGTLFMLFGEAADEGEEETPQKATVGFFAGSGVDLEGERRKKVNSAHFVRTSKISNKPSSVLYQNGTVATVTEKDEVLSVVLTPIEKREPHDLVLRFAGGSLPGAILVCFVPQMADHPPENPIRSAPCACGWLKHASDDNACPYDKTALFWGVEPFEGHPCE